MTVGLRVFSEVERLDAAVVAELAAFSTTDLADAMHGLYVMRGRLRPVNGGAVAFAGPAVTVYCTPGDGLLVRKALEIVRPGDVLVINAGGVRERAVLGGNVGVELARRGVGGVVVDGAVRDAADFASLGLPVLARAVTPRSGSTPAGAGEVNVPVAVDGVVVFPGDAVIADGDGVVVVPAPDAPGVLARLRQRKAKADPEAQKARAAQGTDGPIHGLAMVNEALMSRGGTVYRGPFGREQAREERG